MLKRNLSIFVFCFLIYCGFFVSVTELVAGSITLTNQDKLSYLVKKSDIIAIVDISGGTDKKRILSFAEMPQHVRADLVQIIKGDNCMQPLDILNTPKYSPPNVLKSAITLRNGKHLVFLNRDGQSYQPTTRFSVLPVSQGRVYPIWNQASNSNGVTSGHLLDLVISEIEMEIEFSE